MMRFLTTTFFALSLFIGTDVSVVHAQATTCESKGMVRDPIDGECIPAPAATNAQTPGTTDDASGNKPISPTLGDAGYGKIMTFIMGLFAWLLGIAAVTLDAAVYYTVLTMGSYIQDLSAIGITWTILRDIGNIALIFGFLMAGINIILETHFYGEGQKLIPVLIIVAVSLNFSLFVAEAVIDTGNLFATQIYTAINNGDTAGMRDVTFGENFLTPGRDGVGGIIMAQLGLQTIYGEAVTNKTIFNEGTPTGIAFLSIMLFLVTAFVMFSLAFILVARFVVLILVIITSPIGFIGYAIPAMKSKADLWWHTLFSQTLTAPVLMLSLYVALSVITSPKFFSGFNQTDTSWTGLVTDPVGRGGMMITFLVAMGLLLAVNMIAKDLSAFGASGAMKLAGSASFGVAGWGARKTVGFGSNWVAKKLSGTRLGRIPFVGTGLVQGLHGIAGSSFDVRGIKAVSGIKGAGIEGGDAQKGGYLEDLKKATKARTDYAEGLHGHELHEEKDKIEQIRLQNEIQRLKKARGGARTPEQIKQFSDALKKAEDDLGAFEIEHGTDAGVRRAYAQVLSADFTSLVGAGDFSKNKFVKFVNLAANEEAAKKILKDVKESPEDKALAAAIKKAAGGTPAAAATGGGHTPTGGAAADHGADTHGADAHGAAGH